MLEASPRVQGDSALTHISGHQTRVGRYQLSQVFVVDSNRTPLAPCHPARARQLLRDGKAAVLRRYPFTIILKCAVDKVSFSTLRLKIDPGSKGTGLAIVDDSNGEVVFAAELMHCGHIISRRMTKRRQLRRARRYKHGTENRVSLTADDHGVGCHLPCEVESLTLQHGLSGCAVTRLYRQSQSNWWTLVGKRCRESMPLPYFQPVKHYWRW